MIVTAEQIKQEIDLISTGSEGGPSVSFGENWRAILPGYVLDAWFAPPSIQHASNRYSEYIRALNQWHDELKTKEAMDPLINVLERWKAEIADETVVTIKQGLFSIREVRDFLTSANNELENALSCVHHYKDEKQIKEQVDRLSRNYVALVNRMVVEDSPASEFAIGDLVKTIGLTIEDIDGSTYKLPDSPAWRISKIHWNDKGWTYSGVGWPSWLYVTSERLRKCNAK